MLYVLPCIFTDFVHAVQFMHICILNSFFPNNFVDLIKLCFFGHLRYCHHLVPVIYKFLHCVIFFSETTGPIGTKVCFYLLIRGTQKKREAQKVSKRDLISEISHIWKVYRIFIFHPILIRLLNGLCWEL